MSPDFVQEPPELGNQYKTDHLLRSFLRFRLPDEVLAAVEPELEDMGALAGGDLFDLQQADLENEPVLTQWGPWGNRLDQIERTEVWDRAEPVAAERGLVATAYEQEHGQYSRLHQMALAYLFIPSTDMYGCPLAMTDGAARTLLDVGTGSVPNEAVRHLTSRDPQSFWTSGQWMTELSGGSDVGRARTTARRTEAGPWRLHGRKWFTSAITADMALALARPEGNPSGGRGLALFYVPIRDGEEVREGIYVNRLKNKLGTRKLPTAELQLDGAVAHPVTDELRNGTRHIAPMLNVTRTWNAVTAAALLRRGLALARDYAQKREAFGKKIIDHSLHRETLADLQATLTGCFHLAFRVVELLGRREQETADATERDLFRLLTPIAKLTTAKQAVSGTSEALEAFGGAGYVEDTGLPPLLRDAQVLPIWEGTTNVLALDFLRALTDVGFEPLKKEVSHCTEVIEAPPLVEATDPAREAVRAAAHDLDELSSGEKDQRQASARRAALTLGLSLEVLYTARHAQWSLVNEHDGRLAAAVDRLASRRINRISNFDLRGTTALARDVASSDLFDAYQSTR